MFKTNYISIFDNNFKFNKKLKKTNKKYNLNKNFIYNLELILKIPSVIENKQKFIIMIILMDKYLNNQLKFLLDTKTINRSKSIKIGSIINLNGEMLNVFLNTQITHNIHKFYHSEIIFNFDNKNLMRYQLNKILSNLVFHFDNDTNFYYDYLNDFSYNITFFLKSIFNNMWYNRLFLTQRGLYFFNFSYINFEEIINESWYIILVEEKELNSNNELNLSNRIFFTNNLKKNTNKQKIKISINN